ASFFGDESRQQVGLSSGNQFLHLLFRNFAVQNILADTESARFRRSDGVFARVSPGQNIDLPFLANRTSPERFVDSGVDLLFGVESILAKIELRFEILPQFHGCAKLTTNLAPKSFQRTDVAGSQKFFHFGSFEQSSGHCLPNNQTARSTFK